MSNKKKIRFYDFFQEDEALKENEVDANRQMIFTCAASSILMVVILIGYITHFFPLRSYTLVYIFIPINVVALLAPLAFIKTKIIRKPWLKYILMGMFLWVVTSVSVTLPRHAIILWVLPIILTNHFYSRRFGYVTFIASALLMLFALYMGMLYGEYDPHLLTEGIIVDGKLIQPEHVDERIAMLNDLIAKGDNRYLKVFFYYYLTRTADLFLVYMISRALNKRTFHLLKTELDIDAQKKKMENELQIAAEIQKAALPKASFKNQEISIVAKLYPAKQIGGDFYDYYFLDRNHLAFVIGDVSGKGAPAALFMMKAITCFKDAISLDKTVLETMNEVNAALCKGNEGQMFVTAFFGVLDTRNGELHFVNAGHCPPMIQRKGKFFYLPCNTGFVLGSLETIPLKEETVLIEPRSYLLLYTDGITEAKNKEGELYGKKRALEVANRFQYKSAHELYREVVDDVMTFANGAEQADDLTGVIIHYLYEDSHVRELSTNAKVENLDTVMDFFLSGMKEDNIPGSVTHPISVAIDEVYSNIAKYAYDGQGGDVFLRYIYYKESRELRFTFIDHGVAYDPTKQEKKLVDINGKEGGLGLLIVSSIMDDVDYDRRNGKNFLVLTKKI